MGKRIVASNENKNSGLRWLEQEQFPVLVERGINNTRGI